MKKFNIKKSTLIFIGCLIVITLLTLILTSCESKQKDDVSLSKYSNVIKIDTIETIKIVKGVRESSNLKTEYGYKYDWFNGEVKLQPEVKSTTSYYVIYTDGTSEKISQEKYMFYEKGDTVKSYKYIPRK